jgi:hypothetical protein
MKIRVANKLCRARIFPITFVSNQMERGSAFSLPFHIPLHPFPRSPSPYPLNVRTLSPFACPRPCLRPCPFPIAPCTCPLPLPLALAPCPFIVCPISPFSDADDLAADAFMLAMLGVNVMDSPPVQLPPALPLPPLVPGHRAPNRPKNVCCTHDGCEYKCSRPDKYGKEGNALRRRRRTDVDNLFFCFLLILPFPCAVCRTT